MPIKKNKLTKTNKLKIKQGKKKLSIKKPKKTTEKNNKKTNSVKKITKNKEKINKVEKLKINNAKKLDKKEKKVVKKNPKPVVQENKKINKINNENSINKKQVLSDSKFKINQYIVYPSHGVGKIIDIESIDVSGQKFNCYLIFFEKEKLTIKIPTNKAQESGIRNMVSKKQMEEVLSILRNGVKKMKGMWSRRAQEYETKINSGNIILLAEVLRDLTRDIEDSERSYSERIIYETAINRLASEYSVLYNVSFEDAREKVINTAKDKLSSEPKLNKDNFDDFDNEEESEEEENEEEEEEDDFNYDFNEDDEDDDKPKSSKKKR